MIKRIKSSCENNMKIANSSPEVCPQMKPTISRKHGKRGFRRVVRGEKISAMAEKNPHALYRCSKDTQTTEDKILDGEGQKDSKTKNGDEHMKGDTLPYTLTKGQGW